MTLTVNHSTSADGSFSATGATAWNAAHTLTGTIDVINGGTGQTTTTDAINALLPIQATNSGKYLTTNGTNTSWATVSGGGSPGGSTTQFQYNNASAFGGSANLVYDGTNVQVNNAAALRFSNATTNYVSFKAPAVIGSNVNWTLPNTDGTAGQVLVTNGSGILSWATATLTPTAPTNVSVPTISGTPTVGQTLSSTSGTWNGYPAPTFAYQWVRGASTNISGATSSSYTLVDADYNNTIKCTVTATNSAGSASATSAATATVAGSVPGAPTIGTATAGNTQASVAFTAPAVTGGPAITSYTATSSPGGFTASGSASPLTVTGLTNGTAYTFTVTATNSIGTGPASAASNSVTPTAAPVAPSSVEYLVVAGGGGGGTYQSGGGGAGGLLTTTGYTVSSGTSYTVTIGAGALGQTSGGVVGNSGSNSVFGTGTVTNSANTSGSITSVGGGGGGVGGFSPGSPTSGGSGGGGASTPGSTTGAAGTSGQGNSGGNSPGASGNFPSAGGGGAGAVGGSPATSTSPGGNGGAGITYTSGTSITGLAASYAGGGAGATGSSGTAGTGGTGGGGNGSSYAAGGASFTGGSAGTVNTGGGGGGGGVAGGSGTSFGGGSGVVIVAYPSTFADLASVGAGIVSQSWNGSAWVNNSSGSTTPNTTIRSGYKVYRFSSGTGTIQW